MRTGPGAHFCARIQGLQHQNRARILGWVLKKKGVYASVPNEYRIQAPCSGGKCERCVRSWYILILNTFYAKVICFIQAVFQAI